MKKEKKPVKLWTCDTETRGLFGEVFRVGLYNGDKYYSYYTFSEAMATINLFDDYENHVYIHNLDFDVSKVAPDIFNESSIIFGKSIFINNSAAVIVTEDFTLHDSYKLLTASLDKLCKDFELEELAKKDLSEHIKEHGYKDKDDYFMRVHPDEEMLNEYLKYDCISLYTLLTKVMEICQIDESVLIKCPTAASLSMNVYRTISPEDFDEATRFKYNGTWGRFIEDYLRLGYYGGRTEVFKPYIANGYHYDVNSLYPYEMKTKLYPCGFPQYMEGTDAENIFNMWKRRKIGGGFLYADIYVPDMHVPPLPKRDRAGKLLFPVGKLTGVWTFPEVEKALQLGCEIKSIKSAVFFKNMKPIFKEIVTHFEAVKNNSKGAKRALAKLLQNSLYGKFGMQRKRRTYVDISKLNQIITDEKPYMVHRYNLNLQGVEFIETITESRATYIQPQIAAYVTAYARLDLLEGLLMQDKAGDVAYCDTDSIATTTTLPSEMVDEKEYGKYKLESVIEEGIFLQPKLYAEKEAGGHVTIRAKGIPKEILAGLNFDTYIKWYEIIKAQEAETINIFTDYAMRMKFITMLKNNLDLDTVNLVSKSIHIMAMQKREMDYVNNRTRPYTIENYGDVLADSFIYETKYTKLLDTYDDDADSLLEQIKQFGFIGTPLQGDAYYAEYKKLPKDKRILYFNPDGQSVLHWCELTGWNVNDLFEDIKGR